MSTEDRLQRLEGELDRLRALEDIRQLKARYLNACDRQDPEAVRDCFAEGEVVIPIDAQLEVDGASIFAVTVEPPGGVMVSDREQIVLVASRA